MDARIAVDPSRCGGRPHLSGHRIRVQDVAAWHEFHGMSPDEIIAGYPQLSLADVHAALAYYHSHREEIQQHMKADEQLVESLRKSAVRTTPKATGTDAHGHPFSP